MSAGHPDAAADGRTASAEVLTVARGAGFLAGGQLASNAVRFVMALMLARWLGADDYGLYILAVSVAFAVSSLASLGLDAAMERFVAVDVARGDAKGLSGSLQVGFTGTLAASVLLGGAVLFFADPIADHVFDEPRLESLLAVSAALTPLVATSTLLVAILLGFKRMDQAAFGDNLVQPLARCALLVAIAGLGMTPARAGVAMIASYVVSIAVMVRFVTRGPLAKARGGGSRREIRGIGAFAFPFWFAGVMRIARVRLQPLLLGAFGSAANVGVFTIVTSAGALARIANLSINKALRPTLAQLFDEGDYREVQRLYATTTRWTLAANLPVFLILVLLTEPLLAVFGREFTAGVSALVIVAIAELVNAATGVCGPVIAMSDHNRMKVVNSVVWVGVSLAATVVLIPPFGVLGAAVAILVSTTVINVIRVIELWVLMRIIPWDRRTWRPVAAAAATAAAAVGVLRLLPDELGLALLATVSAAIVVMFAGLLVLFGIEEEDRLVIDRVRQTIRRRTRGKSARSGAPSVRPSDPAAP